jgi:hypothetical protein
VEIFLDKKKIFEHVNIICKKFPSLKKATNLEDYVALAPQRKRILS